jgi:hypothetical protein
MKINPSDLFSDFLKKDLLGFFCVECFEVICDVLDTSWRRNDIRR